MTIILIGFMGAGKTSVGKQLSKELNEPFIDLDHEISKRLEMPISSFFQEYGVEKFRQLEQELLAECHQTAGVISTGGGCIETAECRDLLKNHTQVVYLHAEFDTLWERIVNDERNIRPLASSNNPSQVEETYKKRLDFYAECATYTVTTDYLSTEEVVEQIHQAMKESVRK